ncbi:hypothetical protein [Elioraea sp.]|uniref:hypothetical protein n=1 Tax=Elioraea sp. TaxID=2185103 RepID=UPI003F6FD778
MLIEVLAAAQRFAAWYAEYLSREAARCAPDNAEGELVASKLQHAVFDLMAAVHEMNRHCAAPEGQRRITTTPARVRLVDDALH